MEKLELIDEFEASSSEFDDVLTMSGDLVNFRPSLPDAWSIKEQIIHCLDVDVANFHRYRWGVTNPGTKVLSFSQAWTGQLKYQFSDVKIAIKIIKLLRMFMADHFRSIATEEWNNYYYILGEDKRLNLYDAIKSYTDHVAFHQNLIKRNVAHYQEREKSKPKDGFHAKHG